MKKLLMILVLVGMLISAGCNFNAQAEWEAKWKTLVREASPDAATLEAALKGHLRLGMTEKLLRIIRTPYKINRSVGSWGIHEQWICYGGDYLYLENGILTSWQN